MQNKAQTLTVKRNDTYIMYMNMTVEYTVLHYYNSLWP